MTHTSPKTPWTALPSSRATSPRSIEVDGKDLHSVRTGDDVEILLTRYQGVRRGPSCCRTWPPEDVGDQYWEDAM